MDLKKVGVVGGFLVLMLFAVGGSVLGQEQAKIGPSLSQEDLEIIKDLDLLENLPLLNEEDMSMFIDQDFDAGEEK